MLAVINFYSYWSEEHKRLPKTIPAITTALDYLPEHENKLSLLKVLHTLDTKFGATRLNMS